MVCVGIVPPLRLSSVCGFLLAFYCRAVDNGPPWCLWFVPAVLLALYRRAVDNGPPFVRLLAHYCRAVDNGPPWRLSFVPAVLLAFYCRAVDNGPPWRVSSVPAVLLALYRPALILFRRGVYSPPWVSASSLLPCVGIGSPFVRLLAFYRRAVSCWHSIALRW